MGMNIMVIAILIVAAWSIRCRMVYLKMLNEFDRAPWGRSMLLPHVWGFWRYGSLAIILVGLAAVWMF
jgi:hypothetical protein